jgi:hypothetical protein
VALASSGVIGLGFWGEHIGVVLIEILLQFIDLKGLGIVLQLTGFGHAPYLLDQGIQFLLGALELIETAWRELYFDLFAIAHAKSLQ